VLSKNERIDMVHGWDSMIGSVTEAMDANVFIALKVKKGLEKTAVK